VIALERATAELARRFAHDLILLWRQASLEELERVLDRASRSHESRRPTRSTSTSADTWRTRYGLTNVETAILKAALRGKYREAIARDRGVSVLTIKSHITRLLRKTGDRSLLAATARLLRER